MPKTKEEKAAYQKKYREKNKERISIQRKEYREENKEKISIRRKEYREKNLEKVHKNQIKSGWKRSGLICEDVDSLYCHYMNAKNCDECGVDFGKKGDGTGTFKCMDHSHITGIFRNFL